MVDYWSVEKELKRVLGNPKKRILPMVAIGCLGFEPVKENWVRF